MIRRISRVVMFLFVAILATAYVLYLLDVKYFLLPVKSSHESAVNEIFDLTSLTVNAFLMFWFCSNRVTSLKLTAIFFVAATITYYGLLVDEIFIVYALPILLIAAYSIQQRNRRIFAWATGFALISIVYQVAANFIKFDIFQFVANETAIRNKMFYNFDYFLFLGCLISLKGGFTNESRKENESRRKENTLEPIFNANAKRDIESNDWQQVADYLASLQGTEKVKGFAKFYLLQIVPIFVILAVCQLDNLLLEVCILLITFLIIRQVLVVSWHSSDYFVCFFTAFFIFYFSAAGSIPFRLSLFCSVCVGVGLTIVLFIIGKHDAERMALARYIDEISQFKLEPHCDFKKMKAQADSKGLTPFEIELLKYKYCRAATWAELECKFSQYSQTSIYRKLKVAELKFNK